MKEGNFSGNERYEGFCIDLLKGIASQIGFQYTIRLVPDNMYGVYDSKYFYHSNIDLMFYRNAK